jgi:hypothetical protein
MKKEGESDAELYKNEPTILAGKLRTEPIYRRKYLC